MEFTEGKIIVVAGGRSCRRSLRVLEELVAMKIKDGGAHFFMLLPHRTSLLTHPPDLNCLKNFYEVEIYILILCARLNTHFHGNFCSQFEAATKMWDNLIHSYLSSY